MEVRCLKTLNEFRYINAEPLCDIGQKQLLRLKTHSNLDFFTNKADATMLNPGDHADINDCPNTRLSGALDLAGHST